MYFSLSALFRWQKCIPILAGKYVDELTGIWPAKTLRHLKHQNQEYLGFPSFLHIHNMFTMK